jgi:SAM-dependent methyltransferase
MSLSAKDIFSIKADCYARYRPQYPTELFDFILSHIIKKEQALDCGTGNGQAANILAEHFKKVYAIDISQAQINNAVRKENIQYLISQAEQTPFPENSFNLITVATAIHWFQFDQFYSEMRRIAADKCVFACWGYNLLKTDEPEFNEMLNTFYFDTVYSYWDQERRFVEQGYKSLPFPFEEIPNPGFVYRVQWNMDHLEGYLNTWSAVQNFIKQTGSNPVSIFMRLVTDKFAPDKVFSITFPLFMRIGRIIKKQ